MVGLHFKFHIPFSSSFFLFSFVLFLSNQNYDSVLRLIDESWNTTALVKQVFSEKVLRLESC
jgi:hypothetical protein